MSQLPTGTVTLLFTDIERSTLLLQQVGERYASMLSECRDLLRTAFREHYGHEVDTQGDAFFVAFARASDAVAAAVDSQRALFTHHWPEGKALLVRMGLHTGEPLLASEGYVGLDVHRAARIMSAGHGRQVLLSQTTHDLVEHALSEGVSLVDLGAHRLKDLQHKSHLFQLVIAGLPAVFPPLKTLDATPHNLPVQLTPLIGREQEVATGAALLRRTDVRLLTLTGPGGMGKTRLGLQVAAELSDRFTDGVYFVNLAPISDPALVVPTIAQTLDVKEIAGQSLLDLLKASLREKHLLLLLDNFEQVVRAALQVAELLAACPKLESLALHRELGNKWGMALSLSALASALFDSLGDPATIRALLEESLALAREVGDQGGIETVISLSGEVALSQGDIAGARSLAEKSLLINREIGNREDMSESFFHLARVEAHQGNYAEARDLYEQSLAIAIEGNSKHDIDLFLQGLAGVVAAQGEPAWAARLYGASEAFRDTNSIPIVPVYRAEYEHSVAATRAQLGEQAFAATWAEGRTMTPEQALAARGPVMKPEPLPPAQQTPKATLKPTTYPDGLTTREVEVLRLVAQGLTDAQVAEQLIVSTRTVNSHLTAIYGKIQVSSRSAVTRYALEHHLI